MDQKLENNPLPTEIIPPLPPKSSPLLPILFTFLLTSALFISGYFGYRLFHKTSTSTPAPTNSWATYSNSIISFDYPASWKTQSDTNSHISFNTELNNAVDIILTESTSSTLIEYLEQDDLVSQTAYEGLPSLQVQSTKNLIINGNHWLERAEYLTAADITQITTYLKHADLVVAISLRPTPGNNPQSERSYYDHLLSTFKFSPAQTSPDISSPSGWAPYTLNTLNLTFSLPPDLSRYGDLIQSASLSETGSETCWTFKETGNLPFPQAHAGGGPCGTNHFSIGATTLDHTAGRSGGFADAIHFAIPEGIPPSMINSFTNSNGVSIIRIIGGDHPTDDQAVWEGPTGYFGDLGTGHVGALVQYSASNYQTLTVHMILTRDLTLEIFDQILNTFRFHTPINEELLLIEVVKNHIFSYGKAYGLTSKDQISEVIVRKIEGNYAKGVTGTVPYIGSGSVWFAKKIGGVWTIIEETQEPPSCQLMTQHQFPKSIYEECIEK